MAFIVTGLYVLALFSAGVAFVRRGKKEKQEKEEHCAPLPQHGVMPIGGAGLIDET